MAGRCEWGENWQKRIYKDIIKGYHQGKIFQRILSEKDIIQGYFQKGILSEEDIIRKGYYQRASIMPTIDLENKLLQLSSSSQTRPFCSMIHRGMDCVVH